MAIKYFDYKEWVKADYNYASLLNAMHKTFSKEELESFLVKEMDTKLLTKKQIQKCLDTRGDLSWIKIAYYKKYHAQTIGLKGQYNAVKLVVEKVLRKKIKKTINDKMLTILVLKETLKAYKSKKVRKIIGIKNGL